MRLSLAIAVALLVGCGSPQTEVRSKAISYIVGGTPSTDDPAVVALVLRSRTCEIVAEPEQIHCTGTLIAPRAVLTAAHCVSGLVAADLLVYFGNDLVNDSGDPATVVWVQAHPDWEGRTNDIALVALGEPSSAEPIPMLEQLDADRIGDEVRLVGFGIDDFGVAGVKRQGNASIGTVDASTFSITAAPAMSCDGDSGGPVLLTVDGTEYVAGVTSGGDPTCSFGVNGRVDVHREDFICEGLEAIDALPQPRAPIDPATDYCESGCDSDLDCPAGMNCIEDVGGRSGCALDGFARGTFTDSCASSVECDDGFCAADAGCRCYRECDPPVGGGGCSTGKSRRDGRGDAVLMIAVALALWLGCTRSSKRAGSARTMHGRSARAMLNTGLLFVLAVFGPGCARSGCPAGTDAAGSVGVETHCLESGSKLRHGPYVEWWKDSKPPQRKRAGNYVHGELDGQWTTWFADGQVERVVEYVAGKMHGHSVSFHANGKKQEEGEAREGVRVGAWTLWTESGIKERDVEYLQASNEQRWTSYAETGVKLQSGVFIDGYKEGHFVEYHANGQQAAEGDYRRSKKNGTWVFWADDGKELRREDWKDGSLN